ncbi:hypothetical protein LX36DRAFT_632973 [Colletotrichum falcatum]|nr:hypothetical protein LX36DRAFT_632973 [Colletotrichum falcatum]
MRLPKSLALLLGAALCDAQISKPRGGDVLMPNRQFEIEWQTTGLKAPINIDLIPSGKTDLSVVAEKIGVQIDNIGRLNWSPSASITAFESFAIMITDSAKAVVISEPFQIIQLTQKPVIQALPGAQLQYSTAAAGPPKVVYSGTLPANAIPANFVAAGVTPTSSTSVQATSTEAAPAQSTSEKPTPEEANPEKANPEKADPEKADPEKADPTNPDKANPEKADPEEADPEKADPAKTTSTASTSSTATPTPSTAPEKNNPDKADPEKADPQKSDTAAPAPVKTTSSEATPTPAPVQNPPTEALPPKPSTTAKSVSSLPVANNQTAASSVEVSDLALSLQ